MWAKATDQRYIESFIEGLPIIGPVQRSGRWTPMDAVPEITENELKDRAWEIRTDIINKVKKKGITMYSQAVWANTLKDVEAGYTIGPFTTIEQVNDAVGTSRWIPTERVPVIQKNKIREIDSATINCINKAQSVMEKLALSSTDANVTVIKMIQRGMKRSNKVRKIKGWVLDERKAYRQIPVHPKHRRWAVICIVDPRTGVPSFFVMIGHSFGLVSAVYNYNRRSALINEIITNLFDVPASFFYDDKFGFEPEDTIDTALESVRFVHDVLGIAYDMEKVQLSNEPTILGIKYDLDKMELELTDKRKEELLAEIESIIDTEFLPPASASKLRGRLSFGATHMWGKIGRAFLRAISERQYVQLYRDDINEAIRRSLMEWARIIRDGKRRSLMSATDDEVDGVLFTDGYSPEEITDDDKMRIGVVLFMKDRAKPVCFTMPIEKTIAHKWLPRKNQIALVELFAPIAAVETFGHLMQGKKIIFMIDSESALGALVKGYSDREDMCELVGLFWKQIAQLDILTYLDRVPTDCNPSDEPSRNDMSIAEYLGWVIADPIIPSEI